MAPPGTQAIGDPARLASPAPMGAAPPLQLIATKLAPPTQATHWVDRLHILRAATADEANRVVIVTAPAGYGKTVAISQYYDWLAGNNEAVGWVSLDRTDSDPVTVLSTVITAIRRGVAAIGGHIVLPPGWEVGQSIETSLNGVLMALRNLRGRFHLFLDDVQNCRDEATLRVLAGFVTHAPDNLNFIVASREPPKLSLARLKAERCITVIGWSDLLFELAEAQALFAANQLALTDDQVRRTVDITDGWAMGLQLARMAFEQRDDPEKVIAAFSSRIGPLADLMTDDVLTLEDQEAVEFLVQTSILGRFCAEICNHVLNIANSADLINKLDQNGTLLFSLDSERKWFRHHGFLQDFLNKRLSAHQPSEIRRLQRRAAEWFQKHGHYHDALDMAQATGDIDVIATTLSEICEGLVQSGQPHLLRKAVSRLPLDVVVKHPRLALCMVWSNDMMGNLQEAQHLLSVVENAYSQDPALATCYASQAKLEGEILHRRMMIALSRGDMSTAAALCDELLSTTSLSDPYLIASVHGGQIMARYHLFDCRGITGRAEQINELLPEGGLANGSVFINCIIGLAYERRGETAIAKQAYADALMAAQSLRLGTVSSSMPAIFLAHICYEQNDIAEARMLLETQARGVPLGGLIDQLSSGPITRSRLAALSGDRLEAIKIMDEAIDFYVGRGLDRVRKTLVAERVRQAAVGGRPDEIAQIAAQNGLSLDIPPPSPASRATTWDLVEAMTWCQFAVTTGEYRRAVPVLRRWIDYCRSRNCERPATQMTIQLARVKMLDGDMATALKLIKSALVSGFEMGLVRTFIDEGSYLYTLLSALNEESITLPDEQRIYLSNLLGLFPEHGQNGESPTQAAGFADLIASPLTSREIDILNLASKGIKGRFIAAQLDITEGTVKWHLQQIFDKLDVRTRTEAVKRARELGFIP